MKKILFAVTSVLKLLLMAVSASSIVSDSADSFLQESGHPKSSENYFYGNKFIPENFEPENLESSAEKDVRSSAVNNRNVQPGKGPAGKDDSAYPRDAIKRALEAVPLVTQLLESEPEAEDDGKGNPSVSSKARERSRDFCESKTVTKYPKMLRNVLNQTKWIIQNTQCPNHLRSCMQGVIEVTCLREKQSCTYCKYFPPGSSSFCEQQYAYKTLYTFNSNNNTVGMDWFQIPCGCSCKLVLDDATIRKPSRTPARKASSDSENESENRRPVYGDKKISFYYNYPRTRYTNYRN